MYLDIDMPVVRRELQVLPVGFWIFICQWREERGRNDEGWVDEDSFFDGLVIA